LFKAKAVNEVDAEGGRRRKWRRRLRRGEEEAAEEGFSPTPTPITGRSPREILHKLLYRYSKIRFDNPCGALDTGHTSSILPSMVSTT
jgi:hypothetical protein